jgi:hypothetical protein
VAGLAGAGCAAPPQAPAEAPPGVAAHVTVAGLDLRIEGQGGERFRVSADRAALDDLPGRGRGRLADVAVVQEVGSGREPIRAHAATARVGEGGSVVLEDATVVRPGLRVFARTVALDPAGRAVATGVRATLRGAPPAGGGNR